jgi:hypothetical protein
MGTTQFISLLKQLKYKIRALAGIILDPGGTYPSEPRPAEIVIAIDGQRIWAKREQ